MAMQVEVEQYPQHVVVKLKGPGNASEIERHSVTLVVQCQRGQVQRCLSDMTEAQFSLSTADRYLLARSLDVLGMAGIKLAVLALPTQADPQKLAEKVAQKDGTQMRVFTEKEPALAWLLAD